MKSLQKQQQRQSKQPCQCIRFVNESGQEGFIAIETKYSENLGTNVALDSYSIILAPADHPSTGKEVDSLRKELCEEYKDVLKDSETDIWRSGSY